MFYQVDKQQLETEDGSYIGVEVLKVNIAIDRKESLTLQTHWKGLKIHKTFNPKEIKKNNPTFLSQQDIKGVPMMMFRVFIPNTFANF
jgi:hypothetical protein